jgi:hypothetical protein
VSELHIHVDASYLSHHLAGVLERLGFWRSDFSEQQVDSYAPLHHFTLKPQSTSEFKATFDFLVRWLEENPGNIDGYLEGEVVPVDDELAEGQFDSDVPIPFTLGLSNLKPGEFRESEIHVTLDREKSHPTLRKRLREMGLFSAYLPKVYGIAEVFTVQGLQVDVDRLLPSLRRYIQEAGGANRCSIKEERIARWWVSRRDLALPPIVGSISWNQV